MARHLSKDELDAGLEHILAAPKDNGLIEGLVIRTSPGQRQDVERISVSFAGGIEGDHWSTSDCWQKTEDGAPHPGVQVCLMNSRCIALVAQERENWAPAGDNIFVDIDLTPDNIAPGQRLSVGSAILEISEFPHNGCQSFIDRYGRDACLFVNMGAGKKYRLRGVYAHVVRDGEISVGDRMIKIAG